MSQGKGISIPIGPLISRHMHGVKRVASIVGGQPVPLPEFAQKCRQYQSEAAAAASSLPRVAQAIWNAEGLSITFGKFGLPKETLHHPSIPAETQGICHVGFGISGAEYARFDVDKLKAIFENNCEPNYRSFAYEGVGSAIRVFEPGPFRIINRIMGVVQPGAPYAPDKAGFFAKFFSAFSPEAQRQMTHGYGRLVGFSTMSIHKSLKSSSALPSDLVLPFAQGMTVAYAMLNCEDMPRLLENSNVVSPEPIRASFQNGLVWVLSYCDWFAPGLLAAWKPQGKREETLIGRARAESAANHKRGFPLAGGLENPLGKSAEPMSA
ncbi:MAG: hypothetical protein A3F68_13480 [Acidobacteria bacterium RIFCSPLOWO2_12_FULL_54_10]|nr:MAG: hypothetical protein A3F68_13480 [Acidobacteria bacterium RIFCSPLOWO2_12_FULL_54_10]